MKHFTTPDGTVHGFEDDYEGDLITPEMSPIDDEALAELRKPTLAVRQADAQAEIDAFYEQLYGQTVANSAIAKEYDAAYIVAKHWLDNQSEEVPERIKALAEMYGASYEQAAAVVVQKWTEAQAVAFDLRGAARLRAKTAIRAATDLAGVDAALQAGRTAMQEVTFTV